MINGWKKSALGEVCRIEKGKASAANEPAGKYPLVTTGEERKTATTWQFEGPAVCVPMISAFGHGKAGLKRIHYQEGKFALASILSALIVKNPEELSPKFLSVFLNYYKDQLIVPLQFGAANMSITVERLATVPIWFPTLQKQISLLSLLDEAEALRKARLQASTRMADFVPALFEEMFGNLINNKKKWKIYRFGEICESRLGKMLDEKQQTGLHLRPYLRNQNVQWDKVNTSNIAQMDFDEKDRAVFRLQKGDLLICEGGEVGRTAIWRNELPECYFQKAIHRARPNVELAISEYLLWAMYALSTSGGFSDFTSQATIAHLTGEKLKKLPIPLPPITLQKEFAKQVDEARAIQAVQTQSEERIEALYQSMLSRAFAGQL